MRTPEAVREQRDGSLLQRAALWGSRAVLAAVTGCSVAPASHNQSPIPPAVPGANSAPAIPPGEGLSQDIPVTCNGVTITRDGHNKLKITPALIGTVRNAARLLLIANVGLIDGAYLKAYADFGKTLDVPNPGQEVAVSVRFANYGSRIFAPDPPQPLSYYSHPPFPYDGPPNDAQGGFCPLTEYPVQNVPLG
jgi:hypothetical protein